MKRLLACSLAWFVLALGIAHAVPARPLYEPVEPPRPVVVNLNESVWLGKYLTLNRTFIFEADGTLSYKSTAKKAAKVFKNRGSWRLEGNQLHFEYFTNPQLKLMDFRGTVINANTIVGEATYSNGTKAEQTLQRMPAEIK